MPDTDTPTSHVAQLVERARISMLTTMTAEGKHVSRPMGLQEVEFDGDLWFFASDDSAKAREIQANPQVNVSFSNEKSSEWTSISGTAELVHDRAKAEELWSAPLKVWFPDGVDTPGLVLIKVHADTAEYWEAPSSKVVRLIGAARAAATGDPDKFPSTNETVEL
ncbi:pyridoxamine 5'-phosphate oxidase family protein [Kribbella sp. NPDC056861]|uniref:pyridoxamine 5'-phosphate oxidase family protein n=1 Tax=Kribbella sp. NPDC056861 TaxID=3154857 RepID=UPI00343947E9